MQFTDAGVASAGLWQQVSHDWWCSMVSAPVMAHTSAPDQTVTRHEP
ncbi:hypothetical protein E2C01_101614 [Portunus trituberculatus]|uniref:Uncharacterized protein n=1 Tax=Portunus trituberculatus TaxID=210409 RepID=A0A5B7KMC7_PORTR|nr:hypothetical protein [Portunus trituberculatus]